MKRIWKKMAAWLLLLAMVFTGVLHAQTLRADAAETTTAATTSAKGTLTVSNTANTDGTYTVTNTASVSITGVPTDTTVTYATYQVIYATYDSSSNELTWHLTEWAKKALTEKWGSQTTALYSSEPAAISAISSLTESGNSLTTGSGTTEQNTIVNCLAAYIAYAASDGNLTAITQYGSSENLWSTSSESSVSSATLAVGSYLVIPTATNWSFLNMLVSVDVSATPDATDDNGNSISGTDSDEWLLAAKGAVLKGNELSITKTVSDTENGTYGSTADAQIGTTVYYQVKVYVPKFAANDSEKVFTVTDTATNLKINLDSVKIYAYDSAGTKSSSALIAYSTAEGADNSNAQYFATVESGTDATSGKPYSTLNVVFSNNNYAYYDRTFYNSTYGTYPYEYVIISYSAELLDEAVVTMGNANSATLTYDYDNHSSVTTDAATTTVYTYEVDLTKLGENSSTVLSNASFEVTLSGGTKLYFIKDTTASTVALPVYRVADSSVADTDKSTVITTGTSGVKIIGLDESVAYTITETVAPSGYTLNTNTLTFTITDTTSDTDYSQNGLIDSISVTETQGNNTITWSTAGTTTPTGNTWTVSLDSSGSGAFKVSVTDTKISALPATGSVGIIVFTIAGVIIMILALVLINSGKSRQKKA